VLATANIDSRRCADIARRRFNPDRMAEKYHRVYSEIAARIARPAVTA
jgi:hypothetical protein